MSRRVFRQDLLVLFAALGVLLLLFAALELPGKAPDWYLYYYDPDYTSGDQGGGGDGEGGTSGTQVRIVQEDLLDVQAHTAEGSSSSEAIKIPWANATDLHVSLEWTDDLGDNDRFELRLELEGGVVDSVSGTSGRLELFIMSPAPGNYTVVVAALDCPGQVALSPIDRDAGNDWRLSAVCSHEVLEEEDGGAS